MKPEPWVDFLFFLSVLRSWPAGVHPPLRQDHQRVPRRGQRVELDAREGQGWPLKWTFLTHSRPSNCL